MTGGVETAPYLTRTAGCIWILFAAILGIAALLAAAVSVGAFAIFGPWAIIALIVGVRAAFFRPGPLMLRFAILFGLVSTGVGLAAVVGSSPDFRNTNVFITAVAAVGTVLSALALVRGRP